MARPISRRRFLNVAWQAGLGAVTGQVPGLNLLAEYFVSNGDMFSRLLAKIATGQDKSNVFGTISNTYEKDHPNPLFALASLNKLTSMGFLLADKLGEVNPGLFSDLELPADREHFTQLTNRLSRHIFRTSSRPTNLVMDIIAQTMLNEHNHLAIDSLYVGRDSIDNLYFEYEIGEQPTGGMDWDGPEAELLAEKEREKLARAGFTNGVESIHVDAHFISAEINEDNYLGSTDSQVRATFTIPLITRPDLLASFPSIISGLAKHVAEAELDHFPTGFVGSLADKEALESPLNKYFANTSSKILPTLRNAIYLLSGLGKFL